MMAIVRSPDVALNTVLLADADLTALTGQRIWGGTLFPPASADYNPQTGDAICHRVDGGADDYTDLMQHALVRLKCYSATRLGADTLARTLHQLLQNHRSVNIKWGRRVTMPQILTEPETGWIFSFVQYNLMVIN